MDDKIQKEVENICNSLPYMSNDGVSFKYWTLTGATPLVVEVNHTACYANILNKNKNLNIKRIICYPVPTQPVAYSIYIKGQQPNGKSITPKDDFMRWMNLCAQHMLIPSTARYYTKNQQNILDIKKVHKQNRHVMYSSLCCYRWSEYSYAMIKRVLLLVDNYGMNFWQALAVTLSLGCCNFNHSFLPYITPYKFNLSIPIAGFWFYNHKDLLETSTRNSINSIDHLANSLPSMTIPFGDAYTTKFNVLFDIAAVSQNIVECRQALNKNTEILR